MSPASTVLTEFALGLRFEDIPPKVVERARSCIIDAIGAAHYGARLPWSRILLNYAVSSAAPGQADVIGSGLMLGPSFAALVNGAYAHAFELDSMCQPSVGAHPGASLGMPGLAAAQSAGKSGRELIASFVAGCEVMYRIGEAARHSSERLGFHAPGLLGVFGGAITAGRLMGLDGKGMANALGISGSLCSGLLEFSQSGGGMVKRLHQGRASEGAMMAASLAVNGFEGPSAVLEGKFGFLNVFCRDADVSRLAADLGTVWRTLTTTIKRYACHSTAHVAVTAALELKSRHGIAGDDIESIRVAGSEKLVSHHALHEPLDVAMAQYSAPFSVAVAFYRDPHDPGTFSEATLNDPQIRSLCRRVTLERYRDGPAHNNLASRVSVRMKDGRELVEAMEYFPGMPQRPLDTEQLWNKFGTMTAAMPQRRARDLFESLLRLEEIGNLRDLELR